VTRLVVTADDFGLALPVNEAVERAHRDGVLGAASLMVGGAAAADAVERARRLPGLRVGLHLVVVEGRPVLPADAIPDLVDARGELPADLFAAGLRFFFRAGVRRQLEAEIRAQFEAFRATGLALDHVNAHDHMHLHPTVLGICLRVGREFGMRAVRVPWEPRPRAGGRPRRLAERAADAALAPWIAWLRARLRRAGIRSNDFVLGLRDSGAMDEARVLALLEDLPQGVGEIYFHVATRPCPELERHAPHYRPLDELGALLSPRVREALDRRRLARIGFADLEA
jgi:hopanoid biosynthesis associated protein HpnK